MKSPQTPQAVDVVWILREDAEGRWSAQRQGAPPLPFDAPSQARAFDSIVRYCKDNERGRRVRIDVLRDGKKQGGPIHLDFTQLRREC